jgi:threonine/homoserine/homoserine lactone efflux protein
MGIKTYRNSGKNEDPQANLKRDSVIAGLYTTAVNADFILWWLTIGTTLILNAQLFGFVGFSVFAGVHWIVDFSGYSLVGLIIFKSQRFWSKHITRGITIFCVVVFIDFGIYFMGSALWSLISTVI